MRKKLQTAFQPRQYMLSKDFELYYYEDRTLPKVDFHTHDYYEQREDLPRKHEKGQAGSQRIYGHVPAAGVF